MKKAQILNAALCLLALTFSACAHHEFSSHATNSSIAREPSAQVAGGNSGLSVIQDPSEYSQVFVISDVHGQIDALIAILQSAQVIDHDLHWNAGKSLLVITGDSVDKGKKSLPVLSMWMKLQNEAAQAGGRVLHVLGNHEAEFLAHPKDDRKAKNLLKELAKENIDPEAFARGEDPRGQFILHEPVAAVVGKWFFSHSGFYTDTDLDHFASLASQAVSDPKHLDPFLLGDDSILEKKKWEVDPELRNQVLQSLSASGLFGEVFGHQPHAFGKQTEGRSGAFADGRLIKIDNGMGEEPPNPGSILIFTQPSQMNSLSFPSITIVHPDGSKETLKPESDGV